MGDRRFFEEVKCATATALMRELELASRRWRRGHVGPRDWLFRGQGDERWGLQPSSLRTPAARVGPSARPPVGGLRFAAMWREAESLRDFIVEADRAGLPVPGSDVILRSIHAQADALWERLSDSAEKSQFWPPDHLLEALALAQHYGIPTRLLDWSLDPRASAYFAARDAIRLAETRSSRRLAIWALSRPFYNRVFNFSEAHILLQSPRAGNANMRAQSGMFTLDRNPGPSLPDYVPEPLELALAGAVEEADVAVRRNIAPYLPGLIKLTLPSSEAPSLLYLLYVNGVSAASLFPGYAGVVESIRERRYLRDPHATPKRAKLTRIDDGGVLPKTRRRT